MNRTAYVRHLDTDVRYRVTFTSDRGRINAFVVQLEVAIGGHWRPVIRYDTAHGFAHRDRYEPDGTVHQHELLLVSDFNQALTLAMRTIRQHWEEFTQPFREQAP